MPNSTDLDLSEIEARITGGGGIREIGVSAVYGSNEVYGHRRTLVFGSRRAPSTWIDPILFEEHRVPEEASPAWTRVLSAAQLGGIEAREVPEDRRRRLETNLVYSASALSGVVSDGVLDPLNRVELLKVLQLCEDALKLSPRSIERHLPEFKKCDFKATKTSIEALLGVTEGVSMWGHLLEEDGADASE